MDDESDSLGEDALGMLDQLGGHFAKPFQSAAFADIRNAFDHGHIASSLLHQVHPAHLAHAVHL